MLSDSNLAAKERVSAEFDAAAAADLLTCLLPKYCTGLQGIGWCERRCDDVNDDDYVDGSNDDYCGDNESACIPICVQVTIIMTILLHILK